MSVRIFLGRAFHAGETIALPAAESRHLQVRRLQPGAKVTLFNGDDGLEWRAAITRIGRSEVELRVEESSRPPLRELPVAVTLAIGVPANERMDSVVEKATELGVAAIQPLWCARSVLRLSGERAEARQRHWQAVAAAASEQCGRVHVPAIALPMHFADWIAKHCIGAVSAGMEGEGRGGASDERRCVLSLAASALPADALLAGAAAPAASLRVLSGPEGGLDEDEEAAAVATGFARVSLGPRVLRADTAPLAFLAWLALTHSTIRPR